jgi:hypothetical protein
VETRAVINECEALPKKFTGPKKEQFPETDNAVFTFFQGRLKIGKKKTVFYCVMACRTAVIFLKSSS